MGVVTLPPDKPCANAEDKNTCEMRVAMIVFLFILNTQLKMNDDTLRFYLLCVGKHGFEFTECPAKAVVQLGLHSRT
jgi:hypothetical protein